MTTVRWLAVAALAVTACANLGAIAAPAHADTAEEQFLKAIARQGGLPGAQDNWLQEGHNVCKDLADYSANGVSPETAGYKEIKLSGERGWKPGESLIIIHAALTHLCPDTNY